MTATVQGGLYIPLKAPENASPEISDLYARLNAYFVQLAAYQENVILNQGLSPFRVPDTTIDVGSGPFAFSSGSNAYNAFLFSLLPHMATTTSSTYSTFFTYTGRGVVLCAVGVAQDATHTSTAAGMSMRITIDGNILFDGQICTAVNQYGALVGQINLLDPTSTNPYVLTLDAGLGLTFQKTCLIEYKAGTNAQGVSAGCRVLKLH